MQVLQPVQTIPQYMNCSDYKHLGVPFDRYPADSRQHPFKCLMLRNLENNISGQLSLIRYEQRVRSPDSVWNSGNPAFAICFSSCRRFLGNFRIPSRGFTNLPLSFARFRVSSRCRAEVGWSR